MQFTIIYLNVRALAQITKRWDEATLSDTYILVKEITVYITVRSLMSQSTFHAAQSSVHIAYATDWADAHTDARAVAE